MKHISVILLCILLLSSCSEDPTYEPYLEITPESLVGLTYTEYQFKAMLQNIQSDDIKYEWYFGIGDTITVERYDQMSYVFDESGNYTLSVTAYDLYTNRFLAKKQIPITITSIQPQVLISPTSNDTSIYQNVDGTLQYFTFIANINIIPQRALFYWHATPDLRDDTAEYIPISIYQFPKPNLYHISVDMYDTAGNYLASDTTSINIRKKEITQEMLSNTSWVVIQFYSVPTLQENHNFLPLIVTGVRKDRNASTSYSINRTQLYCTTTDSNLYPPTNRWDNVKLTGTFSNDLSRIDNLHVHETDTMRHDMYAEPLYDISYNLKNLSLLAVTPQYLIYYAHNMPTSGFAENIKITKLTSRDDKYSFYGQTDEFILQDYRIREMLKNEKEYALVIFRRNP